MHLTVALAGYRARLAKENNYENNDPRRDRGAESDRGDCARGACFHCWFPPPFDAFGAV